MDSLRNPEFGLQATNTGKEDVQFEEDRVIMGDPPTDGREEKEKRKARTKIRSVWWS